MHKPDQSYHKQGSALYQIHSTKANAKNMKQMFIHVRTDVFCKI